jgi:drug/metabolite transporter (DMT)-like permease
MLAALVWSLTGPGIKYVADYFTMPALMLAFWRVFIIALFLLIVLLLFKRSLLKATCRDAKALLISGVIGIGIYQVFLVESVARNGAAVGIVLVYIFPVFVTLGSWLFFKEPLRGTQIRALVISLMGCVLLVRAYDPATLRLNPWGAVLGVLSALAHATYTLLSQRASRTANIHPATTLVYAFGAGAVVLLALVAGLGVMGSRQVDISPTPQTMAWVTALALGPTLGGYALFNLALSKIPSRLVSLIVISEVPLAALLGVALLGEKLEALQVLGIGLVLVGIALPNAAMLKPSRWRNVAQTHSA